MSEGQHRSLSDALEKAYRGEGGRGPDTGTILWVIARILLAIYHRQILDGTKPQ